jgi:hypothetical protein
MTDELVAYLLDDLSTDRRAAVEQRLQNDAAWQREFERLKECFASCDETAGDPAGSDPTDRDSAGRDPAGRDPAKCAGANARQSNRVGGMAETVEPPRDLVHKTCCFVERACGSAGPGDSAKAATLASAAGDGGSRKSSWSMADFAVGGGVLIVLGMLMMPALQESRGAARRLTCENNLRTLGAGLYSYQQNHGHWLPTVGPGQTGAQYVAALAQHSGFRPEELAPLLMCPDSPEAQRASEMKATVRIPSYEELASTFDKRRVPAAKPWAGNYAYVVGYRDERGEYHYVKYTGSDAKPMLADPPQLSALGILSGSHGGRGQNVLDQSLGVQFRTNTQLAADTDNMFLNKFLAHDAGCDPDDTVLIRCDAEVSEMPLMPSSSAMPTSPIVPLYAR